jgi:hypothetical protein
MTTSNNYNFTLTMDDAIQQALQLCSEFEAGETIPPHIYDTCRTSLNMMLRTWQINGLGLWKNKDTALFLDLTTQEYSIGPTGSHCSDSFNKTELASDAASGADSVVVDSVSGMTDDFDQDGILISSTPSAGEITLNGELVEDGWAILPGGRKVCWYADADESSNTIAIVGKNGIGVEISEALTGPTAGATTYSSNDFKTITSITIDSGASGTMQLGIVGNFIGMELDDGTLQWSSIIGDLTDTTLPLLDTLTDTAATDNHIYTYVQKTQRPLEINEARVHRADDNDVPIGIIGRTTYKALATKDSTGYPNQIYFDNQLNNAKVSVWPIGQTVKDYIIFTSKIPLMNMDGNGDNFEVPAEWMETIVYNLAIRVAPKLGSQLDQLVLVLASEFYQALEGWDREDTSVFIGINVDGSMGVR